MPVRLSRLQLLLKFINGLVGCVNNTTLTTALETSPFFLGEATQLNLLREGVEASPVFLIIQGGPLEIDWPTKMA
jgi:hypothetical protein